MKSRASKALWPMLALAMVAGHAVSQEVANIPLKEYRSYEHGKRIMDVFIVRGRITKDQLIQLCKNLHTDKPQLEYDFFDQGGPKLDRYLDAASHDLSEEYSYDENWVLKHEIGSLRTMGKLGAIGRYWTVMWKDAEPIAEFGEAAIMAHARAEYSTVYIYQLHHAKTLWRATFPVYYDEKKIANLDGERYFVMRVPAGTHAFRSKHKTDGGLEMKFEAGSTYYLRMELESDATLHNSRITLTPPENGAYEVKQLKPVNAKDILDASLIVKTP